MVPKKVAEAEPSQPRAPRTRARVSSAGSSTPQKSTTPSRPITLSASPSPLTSPNNPSPPAPAENNTTHASPEPAAPTNDPPPKKQRFKQVAISRKTYSTGDPPLKPQHETIYDDLRVSKVMLKTMLPHKESLKDLRILDKVKDLLTDAGLGVVFYRNAPSFPAVICCVIREWRT
ncbi:hypothetical protein QQ045_003517 [Rhodiola kirilowii]